MHISAFLRCERSGAEEIHELVLKDGAPHAICFCPRHNAPIARAVTREETLAIEPEDFLRAHEILKKFGAVALQPSAE